LQRFNSKIIFIAYLKGVEVIGSYSEFNVLDYREFDRLVAETRSTRRFKADIEVTTTTLRELVGLARLTPSSRNLQPLKYILVNEPATRDEVFVCLNWARDLPQWEGPLPPQRPAAFILILGDTQIKDSFGCDHGIAAQTMMLGARARGLGGCIIASCDRDKLREKLGIEYRYDILLIMALGVPGEKVELEPLPPAGDIRYWRDDKGVHHVPKRSLGELVIKEFVAEDRNDNSGKE